MRNVYKVAYVVDYRTDKKRETWDGGIESMNVLANGSAEAAIKIAKKAAMEPTSEIGEEDKKRHTITPVRFTLVGVERLVSDVVA